MGFFSSLFKVAVKEIKAANTSRAKQSKYGKILSYRGRVTRKVNPAI